MGALPEWVGENINQLQRAFPKKSFAECCALSPTLTQHVKDWLSQRDWEHKEVWLKDWKWHGRPQQFAPAELDWDIWLILAGRGFGKTRTGAEWVRMMILTGQAKRIALIGRTAADVRDVMVFGPSGIMACCTEWEKPVWEPSKRQLTWYRDGVEIGICKCYSADNPDQLRGPQHDAAWADEICAWKYADAWDQLQMGLRLGSKPRCVVTTTPRSISLLKKLIERSKPHPVTLERKVRITNGDTRDNRANLAPSYLESMEEQYRNTRLGRQELEGIMLEDLRGALWALSQLELLRVEPLTETRLEWSKVDKDGVSYRVPAVKMVRSVIGVDPAITNNKDSDATGIIAVGLGTDKEAYVLGDYSGKMSPEAYALEILNAYDTHCADAIVIETNRGGDVIPALIMITCQNLGRACPRIIDINSQEGKVGRAEPVVALYEQGRVHHLGTFRELEDEMCDWDPETGKSPNRVDALVFAVAELIPYKPPAPPHQKRIQAQEDHFQKSRRVQNEDQPRRRRRFAWRVDGRSFEESLEAWTIGRVHRASTSTAVNAEEATQAEGISGQELGPMVESIGRPRGAIRGEPWGVCIAGRKQAGIRGDLPSCVLKLFEARPFTAEVRSASPGRELPLAA